MTSPCWACNYVSRLYSGLLFSFLHGRVMSHCWVLACFMFLRDVLEFWEANVHSNLHGDGVWLDAPVCRRLPRVDIWCMHDLFLCLFIYSCSFLLFISYVHDSLFGDGSLVSFFTCAPLEPLVRAWSPCGCFYFPFLLWPCGFSCLDLPTRGMPALPLRRNVVLFSFLWLYKKRDKEREHALRFIIQNHIRCLWLGLGFLFSFSCGFSYSVILCRPTLQFGKSGFGAGKERERKSLLLFPFFFFGMLHRVHHVVHVLWYEWRGIRYREKRCVSNGSFFGCQLFFEAYFVDQVSSDACLLWTDIFSTCSSFSLSFTLEVPVMPCGLFPFPVLLMHYALYIQPILSIYPESCS